MEKPISENGLSRAENIKEEIVKLGKDAHKTAKDAFRLLNAIYDYDQEAKAAIQS